MYCTVPYTHRNEHEACTRALSVDHLPHLALKLALHRGGVEAAREQQRRPEPHIDACAAVCRWMRWVWLTDFRPATALRKEASELSAGIDCVVLLPERCLLLYLA